MAPARSVPSRRSKPAKPAAGGVDVGTSAKASRPASPEREPSHQEIAALAYLYWEQRGCQGGSSEEDWARAQRALRQRASVAVA